MRTLKQHDYLPHMYPRYFLLIFRSQPVMGDQKGDFHTKLDNSVSSGVNKKLTQYKIYISKTHLPFSST